VNFNRAIELDPKMAGAYEGRGTALMAKGDLGNAIHDFDRAIGLDPKRAEAYLNRGLALLVMGKATEAHRDFERTLMLKPQLKDELKRRIEMVKTLRRNGP